MDSTWNESLSVLAQSAISLAALLFVSFQIARERWTMLPMRRFIAVQTLIEFLAPFFFAIIALLPLSAIRVGKFVVAPWQIGGLLVGLFGLAWATGLVLTSRKLRDTLDDFCLFQVRLQPLVFLEFGLILVFSILGNFTIPILMMIFLLFSGSIEAWMFFAETPREERSRDGT